MPQTSDTQKPTLNQIQCFLLDMDGTIYLDDHLLPGARDFLAELDRRKTPYYFLTNNSSRSATDYVAKLSRLGLKYSPEQIFTSGEATALYLQAHYPAASLYLVGTPSLEEEMRRQGFSLTEENPDLVLIGFDTTLTYEKLSHLCRLVDQGLPYIATHPDINCPTKEGFIPDIGALMAYVSASTGRQPDVVVGKPNPPMVEALVAKSGFQPQQMAMIGDRLYTDIAMGKAGVYTILVFSGETQPQDLQQSVFQPDMSAQNLAEVLDLLRGSTA